MNKFDVILNINFNPEDIADENFQALYSQRRRDAMFAYVVQDNQRFIALRDHLGNVPLFYRREGDQIQFSTHLNDIIRPTDTLNTQGIRYFVGLGTSKLVSLINEIGIVPPATVMEFTANGERVLYQHILQPQSTRIWQSFSKLVDETERLFLQSLQRVVKHSTVGLYLSGGIDSALIGLYLRQMNVQINAYTSAPWGETSSEIAFAKINAETIPVSQHHIDVLDSRNYTHALDTISDLYGMPQGTSTAIGVTSLWMNTPIAQEKQIFCGQNSDTLTCSVSTQYYTYLAHFLPYIFRKRYKMPHHDLLRDYIHFASRGMVSENPFATLISTTHNHLIQLTLAGMYLVHTPSDGEVLIQPAIQKNIVVSNPYYDVDLIEFYMGIPLHQRVKVKASSRPIALEKRLFQALAQRRLPQDLVDRKKAFTVSLERDTNTRDLSQTFPDGEFYGVRLPDIETRTSAEILRRWIQKQGLI